MKRIFVLGLMASTLLSAVPAAAQRSGGRGEAGWVNRTRSNPSSDGGQRDRGWSRPAPSQQAAPAVRAAPPPQRVTPTVSTAPVPASNAPRANWRGQGEDLARPVTGGADNRANRQWAGNRDRGAAAAPSSPPAQPTQAERAPRRDWTGGNNGQRGDRDWNRAGNDRRDGTWNRNDNRTDRNWADRDGRGRDDRQADNRWRDNDRNGRPNQPNWNYQRRLTDRDRWSDTRRWDNRWRNDRRYDWQYYRSRNRYVYHLPTYYAPYGWNYGYRSFSIGIYLSSMLFASDYWIDDPYYYRLPPAYGPLRWIRYYDDALLVDIRDGYVVDVIHGFFW